MADVAVGVILVGFSGSLESLECVGCTLEGAALGLGLGNSGLDWLDSRGSDNWFGDLGLADSDLDWLASGGSDNRFDGLDGVIGGNWSIDSAVAGDVASLSGGFLLSGLHGAGLTASVHFGNLRVGDRRRDRSRLGVLGVLSVLGGLGDLGDLGVLARSHDVESVEVGDKSK